MEFLAAIADPNHEHYDELTEFYDADFDPAAVTIAVIEARLTALANRWSPKPPQDALTAVTTGRLQLSRAAITMPHRRRLAHR